ncbi:MAG TPA: methyltransferase domain-containing protein [Roseiflexaceae bacterium]|nr:methyltransferase domain-containing protein [Roseiflexaceae bacterium]
MEIKDSVQKQFAPVAANYATSAVHVAGPDLTAMLAAADARADQRVLDAGCGAGHTALAFAPLVAEVVALDLTEAMLAQGRKLSRDRGIANIIFQRGDVERLPFPDASFDLVTSRYSAHHYPHPQVALGEFTRVLKPGGAFLLVDVVSPEPPAHDTFLNAIELLRDPSHVRDHTVEQWRRMIEAAGLAAEALETWPLRLEFESWVARMQTPFLAITQIRALIDGAPRDIRAALAIEQGYSFSVPTALLRGRRAS